jgi:F-type H+-transporting ATPase subunit b
VSLPNLTDPVFIAKVIDFVIFVAAIVWLYQRYLKAALIAHQEAENRKVAEATAQREAAEQSVAKARQAIEKAKADSQRMLEVGRAQALRLVEEELAAARQHAQRVLAHAAGELDRERYRVRRELLELTVQSAHAEALELARRELDPAKQQILVEQLMSTLERAHA